MALVWTLAIAPLTWVRLVTSSALQSRKWRLIGMNQWCRSALCGHSLPALTDNWTHGAAIRHTIPPISHTRPSPRSRSYYSFPVPLRVGGWVGLGKDCACIALRSKNNMRVQFSLSVHFYLLYLLLNSCDGNDALDWRFSMLVKQSSSLSRKYRTLSLQICVRQTVRLTTEFVDWCRNCASLYTNTCPQYQPLWPATWSSTSLTHWQA